MDTAHKADSRIGRPHLNDSTGRAEDVLAQFCRSRILSRGSETPSSSAASYTAHTPTTSTSSAAPQWEDKGYKGLATVNVVPDILVTPSITDCTDLLGIRRRRAMEAPQNFGNHGARATIA